jgi:diadenosine tetraphosphate (Ap4A) HIT family hydrolase
LRAPGPTCCCGGRAGCAATRWRFGSTITWPSRRSCRQRRRTGFWLETLRAGAAIEGHLRPVKLNYLTLGNALPHLHTHIVPRYAEDPVPGRPFPFDFLDTGRQPEERLQADVLALRAMVAGG